MKIKGMKIEGPSRKTIIIKRDFGDLKFVFEAVLDDTEFNELCPRPVPPLKLLPGGRKVPNMQDTKYQEQLEKFYALRGDWLFLKSISATEGLEWDNVDLSDSSTWINYREELVECGFSPNEMMKLLQAYAYVNGLDTDKVDDAVDSFLAGPQEVQEN